MLQIPEQTFQTFEDQSRQAFIANAVAALRSDLPEFAAEFNDEALSSLVRAELERAERWEIEDEEAIGLMVSISLIFGEDAWDDPALADYVAGHQGDALERLIAILDAYDDEP